MKTTHLVAAAVVCGALSFCAFGETTQTQVAQQSTVQQAKPMQLAYYCGRWGCRGYHRGYYRGYHYRCPSYHCWTGYYGRVHCSC